jgi:hypothetical protein
VCVCVCVRVCVCAGVYVCAHARAFRKIFHVIEAPFSTVQMLTTYPKRSDTYHGSRYPSKLALETRRACLRQGCRPKNIW